MPDSAWCHRLGLQGLAVVDLAVEAQGNDETK